MEKLRVIKKEEWVQIALIDLVKCLSLETSQIHWIDEADGLWACDRLLQEFFTTYQKQAVSMFERQRKTLLNECKRIGVPAEQILKAQSELTDGRVMFFEALEEIIFHTGYQIIDQFDICDAVDMGKISSLRDRKSKDIGPMGVFANTKDIGESGLGFPGFSMN